MHWRTDEPTVTDEVTDEAGYSVAGDQKQLIQFTSAQSTNIQVFKGSASAFSEELHDLHAKTRPTTKQFYIVYPYIAASSFCHLVRNSMKIN